MIAVFVVCVCVCVFVCVVVVVVIGEIIMQEGSSRVSIVEGNAVSSLGKRITRLLGGSRSMQSCRDGNINMRCMDYAAAWSNSEPFQLVSRLAYSKSQHCS